MKIRHAQQGSTPFIIILILLILAILGIVGWQVWNRGNYGDAPASTARRASTKKSATPKTVPPTYAKPLSEVYRVILPETWVSGTCPDSSDLLFLAPSADKLGKCSTESGGTVAIGKNEGNTGHNEEYYTSDDYYGSVSFDPVTIDAITGYKVAYTVATENMIGYPPIGTQQTIYSLYDGTNTYTLVYTRIASDPDLAATVQTLAESFDKI